MDIGVKHYVRFDVITEIRALCYSEIWRRVFW